MEILFIVGALLIGTVIILYNKLVTFRQKVRQAHADIDAMLQNRYDAVENLINTVKGSAKHERDIIEAVTELRAEATKDKGPGATLAKLNAIGEAYPQLRATEQFGQLMAEITRIEDNLRRTRNFLNNAATEYNTAIEQFPAVLVARSFGFTPEALWQVADGERDTVSRRPSVNFE